METSLKNGLYLATKLRQQPRYKTKRKPKQIRKWHFENDERTMCLS